MDHHLADDQIWLCVLYNPVFYTFISAHPKCIKVWDAWNGKLLSVFRELWKHDITWMCLDKRNRKLFVGNSKGNVFSINIKNGAHMKKFEEHQGDVSSLYYWGDKNILLSASWDKNVKLSDDSTSKPEGDKRYLMDKHRQAVNFIDFKLDQSLWASASDDGTVIIYNYGSYRQEGILQPHQLQVKICKFLDPYHILASADLYGYLYFWGIMPSGAKNELLWCIKDDIESEVGTIENFPIRAMDFDEKAMILYTGDEMGNMHQWDISNLVTKLQKFDTEIEEKKKTIYDVGIFKKTLNQFEKMDNLDLDYDAGEEKKEPIVEEEEKSDTFITTPKIGGKDTPSMSEEGKNVKDVFLKQRWKAHTDGITWITFNQDPKFIVTSSFDKNVYIWNENWEKIGSLVLGHDKNWGIIINKKDREDNEKNEAQDMFEEAKREESGGADGAGGNKERDLRIMEQLREFQRKKNIRKKQYIEY